MKIELTEDKYKSKVLAAGEFMDKNPKVTNIGKNDGFVFLEIIVPLKEFTPLNDTGEKISAHNAYAVTDENGNIVNSPIEIFNFRSSETEKSIEQIINEDDYTIFEYAEDWVLLDNYTKVFNNNTQKRYVFGYRERLSTDESSKELFDVVQLKNILEARSLSEKDSKLLYESIIVNAYGIQCDEVIDEITKETELIPLETAETILSKFWSDYVRQVTHADE